MNTTNSNTNTVFPVKSTEDTHGGFTGLEALEIGAARVQVDDKKIINCRADLNQPIPVRAIVPTIQDARTIISTEERQVNSVLMKMR